MRPRAVMKFGGTSVGTSKAIERVISHVTREKRQPLVVVSAVGGVTDLILAAAGAACTGDDFETPLAEISRRHRAIADELQLAPGVYSALEAEMRRILQGISLLREMSSRVHDMLVSLGERISVRLVAASFERFGHRARAWDAWELGMVTNEHHGHAEPLPDVYHRIQKSFGGIPEGEIPVVNGFIGKSLSGEVTTLGRGGSDFSAAVFGVGVKADEIQIWTDVPGILRADPRAVEGAEIVPAMRFEEAAELAYFGAKVLHPRTIEPARSEGIPVRVLGTFTVDPQSGKPISEQGTLIDDKVPVEPIRAMAIRLDVQTLHIHSLRMLEAPGFLSRIFEIFARHHISVDVIATSEVSVSMTFNDGQGHLDVAIEEIKAVAEVEQIPNRTILCIVGAGLRKDASTLAQVFQILAANEVPVRVISQGASRINITIVTDPPYARQGMKALYDALFATPRP